jgi:hypothetical protein
MNRSPAVFALNDDRKKVVGKLNQGRPCPTLSESFVQNEEAFVVIYSG